ncbi:hypothetical protein ASG43_06800 [Aureimonas sp. Leaf454]|uniref:efflux RND transporter periplasmic adaptor subunit n=1 Tax=Aureimonas sp. Leaf454 TaxID=1736381 RepID=UPI0006F91AA8|nr:efflux RND transporter periplasmic adaptor subunit [Aureimonas sp. Leaf454]KQT50950.1 hypothetical protein ASG43_06800 [Aureimonas sp. Leaf454]
MPMLPLTIAAMLAALVAATCGEAFAEDAAASVPPAPERASLTVTTDAVIRESVATTVSGTGLVEPWQEASVGASVGGLALTEVRVEEGQSVAAGDVIARLDASLLDAELAQSQAALRSAEASYAAAVSANERGQRLGRSGSLAAETIEQRETAVQTSAAAVEQARASVKTLEVQIDRTIVRAPFAGIVSSRPAVLGTIVAAGTEIVRLQRDGRLQAAVKLPEQYLSGISVGDAAEISGPNGATIAAKVAGIAEIVDPTTHLGLVRIDLPKDAGLRAGMFVRAGVSAKGDEATTVASSALTFREGRPAVFVVGDDLAVTLTPVSVGTRGPDRVAVEGALSPGERVVTSGAGFLNDGATVRIVSKSAGSEAGASERETVR